MTETEVREKEELRSLVESSVDSSVERAFRRYARASRVRSWLPGLIILVVVLALAGAAVYWLSQNNVNEPVAPVEDHDLTLENDGIFGFTVADFQEAVLGEATRQRLLIVEEQEVYVNTTITDTGLFNWGVFNKEQTVTLHGTGQYTIDLSLITPAHIILNEDTYELTIRIPRAELHETVFDPARTEVGDVKNGWLAFGSIKLTPEQQKEFEIMAMDKLTEKLSEEKRFAEADRFAKLSAFEVYQPIVKLISPAYAVVIEFQ